MPKKKTTEDFKIELYKKYGGDFILDSEYKDSKTKVIVTHLKCGQTLERYPNDLIKTGCTKCNQKIMGRKYAKTTEQYKKEVFDLVGEEYLIVGEYISNKEDIEMLHNIENCKHSFCMSPNSFLRGQRCPKCGRSITSQKLRKSKEKVLEEINSIENGRFKLKSEYISQRKEVVILDTKCGNMFSIRYEYFINHPRCHVCEKSKSDLKTHEVFEQELKEVHGENEYTVLSQYRGKDKKIKIKHNKCGETFDSLAANVLRGSKCPYCSGKKVGESNNLVKLRPDLAEEWDYEKNKITPNRVTLGSKRKVWWKCKKGHSFECCIGDRTREKGVICPICTTSKGEIKIEEILLNDNIEYKRQYFFEDLKGDKRVLSFDFAILNKDKELICLIEYDGEQHFEPVKYFGGVKAFNLCKKRDEKKNKYCYEKGIPIYRIPYWEFKNIEIIISTILS